MVLTALVKDELSRLRVARPCCRKAEVSVVLRLAGGLCVVGGRIVVEAELDTDSAARRLGRDIAEVFGQHVLRHQPERGPHLPGHPGRLQEGDRGLVLARQHRVTGSWA